MTPDNIQARLREVSTLFDTLKAEQIEKQNRIAEISDELLRLQGEHRLLSSYDIMNQPQVTGTPPNDQPLTVVAPDAEDAADAAEAEIVDTKESEL